jgi:hypothetical protein
MSEPTTEEGRDMLAHCVQYSPLDADKTVTAEKIIAIETEARANADREVTELRAAADDLEKAVFGWFGVGQEAPTILHARTRLRRALNVLAASEKSL